MTDERYCVERHGDAAGTIKLKNGRILDVWAKPDGLFLTDGDLTEEEHHEIQELIVIMHMDFTGYVH